MNPVCVRVRACVGLARGRWVVSFDSAVDLLSFTPHFLELGSRWLTSTACGAGAAYVLDLPAFQFVRVLRLCRVLRVGPPPPPASPRPPRRLS